MFGANRWQPLLWANHRLATRVGHSISPNSKDQTHVGISWAQRPHMALHRGWMGLDRYSMYMYVSFFPATSLQLPGNSFIPLVDLMDKRIAKLANHTLHIVGLWILLRICWEFPSNKNGEARFDTEIFWALSDITTHQWWLPRKMLVNYGELIGFISCSSSFPQLGLVMRTLQRSWQLLSATHRQATSTFNHYPLLAPLVPMDRRKPGPSL